ncbi:MAG TPA: translocation/assembly module TamB domain-containing protein [Candidatus Krumholzibacteria bacterium]|nr:translocation/assembly module TamB domain-containing protein [Candidatus Krumholzibacteria bacterium]
MTRARRITGIAAIGAGALVVLVVLFAAFIVFTTPGAKLALSVANGRELPVRAVSIDGTLARRFTLYGLEVRTGSVTASIDTVVMAWRPLALRHRRLDLEDVTIAGAGVAITLEPDDSARAVPAPRDTATAPWAVHADRVRVRRASVDAPGDVHLREVEVTASGGPDGYQADVRVSGSAWRFAEARAFVRASGNSTAATVDSLEARVLGGVVRGHAFVRWDPALSWRARLAGDSLQVGELADVPEDWMGAVSFRARGTGSHGADSLRVGLDLESLDGSLRGKPLSARARVEVGRGRIEASDASVRWGSARATLEGSMAEVADVRLDAEIPSLAEILPRAQGSASVRGRLAGSPERIEVDVEARGRGVRAGRVDIPDLDATVDATLDASDYAPQAADVRRADVRVGDGSLEARGKVSWRAGIEWDAAITMSDFETSTLTPARWNLYGPVSMRATTAGHRRARDLQGSLKLESLSGTLRGHALSGAGNIAFDGDAVDVAALRVAWGDAHVVADGHAGDTIDIDFDVTAPNLAVIDSSLAGAVSLKGSMRGTRKQPGVTADVAADSVRVGAYAVHQMKGRVDADFAFAAPADVRLLALGVARGGTVLDTVRVDASGPRDAHTASLLVARKGASAAVTLRGALADSAWSGWIEDVRVHDDMLGDWRTNGRSSVFVSSTAARTDSLVLDSEGARLSARVSWRRGDSTHVAADLRGFELSRLQRRPGRGLKVTGALEATAMAVVDPSGRILARADVGAGPGEIALQDKKVGYRVRASARSGADQVSALVDADVDGAGAKVATIDGSLAIAGFVLGQDSLGAQPIEGRLDVDCRDVGPLLAVLAPSLTNASGSLVAHVTPAGTAGDFRVVGQSRIENARVDLPSGIRLRDIDISVASDGTGSVELEGGVTSGGGRVAIAATSARSDRGWLNGTFTAKGERFQAVNQPEAQVFVSPDVDVRLEERTATIGGSMRVPFARIETAQVPASASSASNDVVFVEDTLATKPTVRVSTRVRVELGDSVTFNGFGLRGRLTGGLQVADEPGRPTAGTGEIQIIDGKYRAFGNELTIDPGRFVFGGGAIDNPGLDVRAYRGLTTQNVMAASGEMVGVNLRGTLRRPEFSVFSNPPMSESEIMSYLVLGRSTSSGSSGEQSALTNAALMLGMQQGTNIAGDIGKKLALDEAYLDAGSDVSETSFVAGKYLSPKLYVSYAAGLFEHTNTFRTRYSLSSRWTVQTESGTKASSTDLLYWFERGK